jgi:hypothetical protein
MWDYDTIIGTLISLLDRFLWLEEATTMFKALKVTLTMVPVLVLLDFSNS